MKVEVKIPTAEELQEMADESGRPVAEVAKEYATPDSLAKTLGVDSVIVDPENFSGQWLKAGTVVTAVKSSGLWGEFEIPFKPGFVLTAAETQSLNQIEMRRGSYAVGAYLMVAGVSDKYDPVAQATITLLQDHLAESEGSGVNVSMMSYPYFAFNNPGYLTDTFEALATHLAPYLTPEEQGVFMQLELGRPSELNSNPLQLTANTPKEIQLLEKLKGLLAPYAVKPPQYLPRDKGWDYTAGTYSDGSKIATLDFSAKTFDLLPTKEEEKKPAPLVADASNNPPNASTGGAFVEMRPPTTPAKSSRPVSIPGQALLILETRLRDSLNFGDLVILEDMELEETQTDGFYSLSLTTSEATETQFIDKLRILLLSSHSVGAQQIHLVRSEDGNTLTFDLATDEHLKDFVETRETNMKQVRDKSRLLQALEKKNQS